MKLHCHKTFLFVNFEVENHIKSIRHIQYACHVEVKGYFMTKYETP